MQQNALFYEDINEAVKVVVSALGGAKKVGPRLWPEKSVEAAQQLLLQCLNTERKEHLTPEQLLLLMVWGREASCHAAMEYLADAAGYERPKPIAPADKAAELMREFNRRVDELGQIQKQLQATGLPIAPTLKAVP